MMYRIRNTACSLCSLFVLFSSCSDNKPAFAGREEQTPRPVYTMEVPSPQSYRPLSFSGISKPLNEIVLSFRVSGKLTELPIKLGMQLEAGALIGQLDTSDYKLDVQKSKVVLEQAKSQLETAKANYERTRLLYEAADVSQSLLEQQLATYTTAKAQLENAKTALQASERQLSYCTLTAPVSGVITMVFVTNFQAIPAGQPIAKMESGNNLMMEIGLPEALIGDIHLNDTASVVFDAFHTKTYSAVVSQIGITISPASTYPVELTVTDQDENLRPGMSGEATLRFKQHSSTITIPLSAIVSTVDGKHFVWIYREKTHDVTQRFVEMGPAVKEGVEIKSGLNPGETIVFKGVNYLREGMKVNKINE